MSEPLQNHISRIRTFLHVYRWISDAYISDFYVDDLWGKIPEKWRPILETLDTVALSKLLDNNCGDCVQYGDVWPLSLLCYKATASSLSLPRTHYSSSSSSSSSADGDAGKQHVTSLSHCYRKHVKPKKQHEIKQLAKEIKKLSSDLNRSHVIDIGAGQGHLSRLLSFGYGLPVTTVEAAGCHAPKAEKFDREVKLDIEKGQKRKKGNKQVLNGEVGAEDPPNDRSKTAPNHIIHTIEPSMAVNEFISIVKQSHASQHNQQQPINSKPQHHQLIDNNTHHFKSCKSNTDNRLNNCTRHVFKREYDILQQSMINQSSFDEPDKSSNFRQSLVRNTKTITDKSGKATKIDNRNMLKTDEASSNETMISINNNYNYCSGDFILTGLHACGDLTPTIIRVFTQSPQMSALVSVGCCYMKMTCGEDLNGFPMSDFVKSLPDHDLSFEARSSACHFNENYQQRLIDNLPELKLHSYRAALQVIIRNRDSDMIHGAVKICAKKYQHASFTEYANIGLRKLGMDGEINESELKIAEQNLLSWKNVVAFNVLHLMLTPVIETFILLDRVLYLHEHGIAAILKPIFDPKISPRNFVLLAMKSKNDMS
ncbi:methyltransferase-like protein 25B [Tubulanus polymorphus]|uniref:methyltransferase-like protein 25B n=1 Tax=Tubulanus polymorphus TaxID=672921 RepID=UPI003DA5DE51